MRLLGLKRASKKTRSADGLPAEELRRVSAENVWDVIEKLRDPDFKHIYGQSTDFDLVTSNGERFPPKAVLGIAASEALGFQVLPRHFTGGRNTTCFKMLEEAGFRIIDKSESFTQEVFSYAEQEDEIEWAEGEERLRPARSTGACIRAF